MKVNGKVWVVTGGGSGIGRELVLQLLRKGAQVAMVDINEQGMSDTSSMANAGTKLSAHKLSVSDRTAVAELPNQVIEAHGRVDGIINNAGIIQPFVRINELDEGTIKRVIDINLYGVIFMIKSFLPHLLNRPEGHIVNISSMGGFLPVPGQSVYGASKAAVKLLTEGLHAELSTTNVRVTAIYPGAIATSITKNSGVEVPGGDSNAEYKALAADRAAELIIQGIERNKFRVLVGSDSKMMDRLYRLAPEWAAGFISKRMQSLLG